MRRAASLSRTGNAPLANCSFPFALLSDRLLIVVDMLPFLMDLFVFFHFFLQAANGFVYLSTAPIHLTAICMDISGPE